MTASRASGDDDTAAVLASYAEAASEFPDWAIRAACREWRSTQKFWPAWAEILTALDNQVAFPRALLDAYRAAQTREPLLVRRDPMELPREQWAEADWQAYVQSAISMAETMAILNPQSPREWIAIAHERFAQAKLHGHDLAVQLPPIPAAPPPTEEMPNE